MSPLPVGLWSFAPGADPRANAATVHRGVLAAAAAGVRVLLTPECALTGYPGAARPDLTGLDGCLLATIEDDLLLAAERAGVVLVLGSAAPDGAGGWTNDAATATVRYRKRRLTPGDTAHFTPGHAPAVLTVDGWRLGLAICYDLRFPAVWSDLHRSGVDGLLVVAHMAGPDADPGTKAALIPAFCAVRAAEAATPLALCTAAVPDRWLDSGAWDARGAAVARDTVMDAAGSLLATTFVPRGTLHPWYAALRRDYRRDQGLDG